MTPVCDRGSNTRGGLQVRWNHRRSAPPRSCLVRLHRPWLRPSACPLPGLPHLLRRLSRVSPPHGPRRGRQAGFLERFGVPLFRAAARLMPRLAPLADQVHREAGSALLVRVWLSTAWGSEGGAGLGRVHGVWVLGMDVCGAAARGVACEWRSSCRALFLHILPLAGAARLVPAGQAGWAQ